MTKSYAKINPIGAIVAIILMLGLYSVIPVQAYTVGATPLPASELTITVETNGVTITVTGNDTIRGLGKTSTEANDAPKTTVDYKLGESCIIYGKMSNGNITKGFDFTGYMPKPTNLATLNQDWINRDIYLTIWGSVSPYNISRYEYSIDGGGWTHTPSSGKSIITMEGVHNIASRAIGLDGTPSATVGITTRIDRSPPVVDWTAVEEASTGTANVRIQAEDQQSGIAYIELPDGKKEYASKYNWRTNVNGMYTFNVYNNAGGVTSQTFNFTKIRDDYYIQSASIIPSAIIGAPLNIETVLGCRVQKHPTVALRASNTATGEILWQEEISLSEGTTMKRNILISADKVNGASSITLEINPVGASVEVNPDDNTKILPLNAERYNVKLLSIQVDNINVTPGQEFFVSANVAAEKMSFIKETLVEFFVNGVLIDSKFITLGKDSSTQVARGTVQAPITPGPFNLVVKINRPDISVESDINDNNGTVAMNAAYQNLGVTINAVSMIDNAIYGYASKEPDGVFKLATKISTEKIDSIVFDGKKINVNDTAYTLTVKNINVGEKIPLRVSVVSADGKYTKDYNVFITKHDADVGVTIKYKAGTKTDTKAINPAEAVSTIHVPRDALVIDVEILTDSPGSQITVMNGTPNDNLVKNRWAEQKSVSGGSAIFAFTVVSEDGSVTQQYSITFTNSNVTPLLTIVNTSELNSLGVATSYGLNGIVRGGAFIKYGKSITGVNQAIRDGVTNGVIVQVQVSDPNVDQELQGFVELGGMQYPITWGSFSGSRAIAAPEATFGYAYIYVTESTGNGINLPMKVSVSDHLKNSSNALSTASKVISITIDTAAPSIAITAAPETQTGIVASVMIDGDKNPIKFGATYQLSKNGGRTWSKEEALLVSTIPVTGKGEVLLRVQAKDALMNKGTQITTLLFTMQSGKDTESSVFVRKSRLADYYFIGTNKQSDGALNPGSFKFE